MIEKDSDMYANICKRFLWSGVDAELGWPKEGPVNLAQSIIDRHRNSDKDALIYVDEHDQVHHFSYAELARYSDQFANVLTGLGVRSGDRVAGLMPRGIEVLIAILATFKCGAVYVPIFTGFGVDAVVYRLNDSASRFVVTHQNYRKLLPDRGRLQVICVHETPSSMLMAKDLDFWTETKRADSTFNVVTRNREDVVAIIYTSGSTGQPKGGAIAVNFLASTWPYVRYGADMQREDIVWPTGDPGWGYGFVCYLGALATGSTIVGLRHNPQPDEFLSIMARFRVTNLATTPTLLRSVMALGEPAVRRASLTVRTISSCGEPLNSKVVNFFQDIWNRTPMDHFGATEYGLPIGNFNSFPMSVKPGSMGLPFPGHEISVLDEYGNEVSAGAVGLLAKRNSKEALYWLQYWNNPQASSELVHNGWIVTGDLARRDRDGYYWFEGRVSDMIKSSGYRIGPFEVESALLKYPAVAEAAVVGKPDAHRGQIVKAYITLLPGYSGDEVMAEDIKRHVKATAGKHLYPREIEFVQVLPKTETGKIQRFLLRDHN